MSTSASVVVYLFRGYKCFSLHRWYAAALTITTSATMSSRGMIKKLDDNVSVQLRVRSSLPARFIYNDLFFSDNSLFFPLHFCLKHTTTSLFTPPLPALQAQQNVTSLEHVVLVRKSMQIPPTTISLLPFMLRAHTHTPHTQLVSAFF